MVECMFPRFVSILAVELNPCLIFRSYLWTNEMLGRFYGTELSRLSVLCFLKTATFRCWVKYSSDYLDLWSWKVIQIWYFWEPLFKAFKFLRLSNVGMKETVLYVSHGNFGWKGMTEYIYNYGTQNTGKKFRWPNSILNFFPAAQNHIIQHHHHFMYEMLYEIHTVLGLISKKGRGKNLQNLFGLLTK